MKLRRFGSTGIDVPVIGQGTWQLGDPERAAETLRRGLDAGLTHIDTAELYEGAEEIIAPVIRERRDEVFLVSKVLPSNGSRAGVRAACERSLATLGTDHLDVYLLHWPDVQHPLAETMSALAELVDEGKTRFLGVSNFEVGVLEEAAKHTGRHRIVCNQVLYHLGDRWIEHEVLPYCAREDIAVVAYSPFGTGDFPPAASPRGAEALSSVARRHGATVHQVALAYLVRHPAVFAIPKSENPEHAVENGAAADLDLTDDDVAAIDAAFPLDGPG